MATYQEQIERRRLEKERDEAQKKMTADQVANWRGVLSRMGIPFAASMPEEMVLRFRDAFQERLNRETSDRNEASK
jgi:hypothetical protein